MDSGVVFVVVDVFDGDDEWGVFDNVKVGLVQGGIYLDFEGYMRLFGEEG
ncbi:hypothetical protein [Staphylococcus epidermidis]|nr:hypothetical protein [Staphylococcus epidermidis]